MARMAKMVKIDGENGEKMVNGDEPPPRYYVNVSMG